MSARDVNATRWSHLRRRLRGPSLIYGGLFGAGVGIAAVALHADPLVAPGLGLLTIAIVAAFQLKLASDEAAAEFFGALAPTLGLTYVVSGLIPPLTPLLSAGRTQVVTHAMGGPLFGRLGGPECTLAHYEYRPIDDEGKKLPGMPFTVCAMELDAALPVFHGVYLRRRPGLALALAHDWLDRAPRPKPVDLESSAFEELYELRVARDQDRLVLHQLFSPSFIVWLSEHPLRPGFECKAGMLVVFVPEHEGSADHLTLLHEAAREIARRVIAAVESSRALTPAG
jgi:hypothetical protein